MRLSSTLATRVDGEWCVVSEASCLALPALEASLESFETTDVMVLLLTQLTLTFGRVLALSEKYIIVVTNTVI